MLSSRRILPWRVSVILPWKNHSISDTRTTYSSRYVYHHTVTDVCLCENSQISSNK